MLRAPRYILATLLGLSGLGCGAVCGDGKLEANEACDDGNNLDADGCEADCSLPACGNGIRDPGELCLGQPQELDFGGERPNDVVAADFNGDGLLDLATTNAGSDDVGVLLATGPATFAPPLLLPAGGSQVFLATGDVNNDSILDLVNVESGDSTVSVFLGQPNGQFLPRATFLVGNQPQSVALGDIDNDGFLDLVTGNLGSSDVTILFNDQTGGFANGLAQDAGSNAVGVTLGDFDQDSLLDVAVGRRIDTPLLFFQDDTNPPPLVIAENSNEETAPAADLDGDGLLDFAIPDQLNNVLRLVFNQGARQFEEISSFALDGIRVAPGQVLFVDFDGNGQLDLLIPLAADKNLGMLFGLGGRQFSPLPPFTLVPGTQFLKLAAGDFNGDGAPDLAAVTGGNLNSLLLFLSEP
jgi:cysteine-rich repeat protein